MLADTTQLPHYQNSVCLLQWLLSFRLYRVTSESEALQLFNNFSYKLTALMTGCRTKVLSRDWLQQFCDLLRSNPGWTAAHVAARMSLIECFRSEFVATYVYLKVFDHLLVTSASEVMNLPQFVRWFVGLSAWMNIHEIFGKDLDREQ